MGVQCSPSSKSRRNSGSSGFRNSLVEEEPSLVSESNRPLPLDELIATPSTLITASPQHWYDGLTADHRRILLASLLGWIFDGYESYALFIVLPFALQDILTPVQARSTAVWAGIAISTTLLGWGIGGLIGGTLADYIGRKRMMLYSVLLYGVFTGLTALSTNFTMLAGLRFLTGLAMGSEWSTGVALLAETWPDHARPKGCGFLQSGFGWGALLASVAWWIISGLNPLGSHSWRLMFVVGALPAFFTLYIRQAIKESEKWIQAVREHRWAATDQESGIAPKAARRPLTLAEIFREHESRRRIFLTFLLSLATMVGWWAISSWLPAYTQQLAKAEGYANATQWGTRSALLYTAGAIVAYMISGFVIDAVGRRKFLFFTYLGALVMTPMTFLWTHSVEAMTLVAAINGFFTLGCAYTWMAVYPAELFTSTVRCTAASFIFNGTRMIAWIFPIIAGSMIQRYGGIPRAALSLGTIYLVGLIVPWLLPETRGKSLPS
jgi:MFS family permease